MGGVSNPGKTFYFSFFSILFHRDDLNYLEFKFTRQSYFYVHVSFICTETLLNKMAKLVWRYSDDIIPSYH